MRNLMHKPAPLASRPAVLLWALAVFCFGVVGLALVSQYQFDMQPCAWCAFQRLIFLALGAVAVVAALVPARPARLAGGTLGLVLSACGIAAGLWLYFVASKSPTCDLTLADRIMKGLGLYDSAPAVFAPMANCMDAAVPLLGVPYPLWSFVAFVLCGAVAWRVIRSA